MRVLVVDDGGRAEAVVWKLRKSPLVEKVLRWRDPNDRKGLIDFVRALMIDFVIVDRDDALAGGMVDALLKEGIETFGPTQAAAQIEWSKSYAKELMRDAGIPTAPFQRFSDPILARAYLEKQKFPIVIKADGLMRGKGVVIAKDFAQADHALADMPNSSEIIVEEFLIGREISVHALCDGTQAIMFPPSQDHKTIFDNDKGPNTGGMGAVAPVPFVTASDMEEIKAKVVLPLLTALRDRGTPYKGLLYPGIMLTKDGPKVIEFNARFGNPEAQVYMRLLKSDLVPALLAASRGDVSQTSLEWREGSACSVVMASGGYPGEYKTGVPISGIAEAEKDPNVIVFQGATKEIDGGLVTNGGRVLDVTAIGPDLPTAIKTAYAAIDKIHFDGVQYRKDIGQKSLYTERHG